MSTSNSVSISPESISRVRSILGRGNYDEQISIKVDNVEAVIRLYKSGAILHMICEIGGQSAECDLISASEHSIFLYAGYMLGRLKENTWVNQ